MPFPQCQQIVFTPFTQGPTFVILLAKLDTVDWVAQKNGYCLCGPHTYIVVLFICTVEPWSYKIGVVSNSEVRNSENIKLYN